MTLEHHVHVHNGVFELVDGIHDLGLIRPWFRETTNFVRLLHISLSLSLPRLGAPSLGEGAQSIRTCTASGLFFSLEYEAKLR